jgi:hypothetical protein
LIIGYCKSIFIKRPKFIVREKGRLRVLEEGRKNVHAFIVGECPNLNLWSWQDRDITMGGNPTIKVFYNPYKYSTFVDKDGNPIHEARAVLVNTNYIQAVITNVIPIRDTKRGCVYRVRKDMSYGTRNI